MKFEESSCKIANICIHNSIIGSNKKENSSFVKPGILNFYMTYILQVFVRTSVPVHKTGLVVICVYVMQRKGTGDDNPHSELMFE
jgi:hypothetical protein